MSARYTTGSGRVKPSGGGWELAIWYLMRLTGLGLFVLVLSHYLILHIITSPDAENAGWIVQMRWSSTFWRAMDWLLLMLVLFHSFMGMRTVVADYTRGGARAALTMALYALAIFLFAIGTIVVMTVSNVVPPG